jgi:hypothetical protein
MSTLALQAVQPVLEYLRLWYWDFNDLVPQRVRIVAAQLRITLGAALRAMLRHRRDLLDRSKLSFMEDMSFLPAAPLPCYRPTRSLWLGWGIR